MNEARTKTHRNTRTSVRVQGRCICRQQHTVASHTLHNLHRLNQMGIQFKQGLSPLLPPSVATCNTPSSRLFAISDSISFSKHQTPIQLPTGTSPHTCCFLCRLFSSVSSHILVGALCLLTVRLCLASWHTRLHCSCSRVGCGNDL